MIKLTYPTWLLTIVAVIVDIFVMMVVVAMFAAGVMAVDPGAVMVGPMACDPDHFIVARPIAGAMGVVRPVADLYAKALGSRSSDR